MFKTRLKALPQLDEKPRKLINEDACNGNFN